MEDQRHHPVIPPDGPKPDDDKKDDGERVPDEAPETPLDEPPPVPVQDPPPGDHPTGPYVVRHGRA